MVANRRRENRKWYWWTAAILALGAAVLAFGGGAGRDGAEDIAASGGPGSYAAAEGAPCGATPRSDRCAEWNARLRAVFATIDALNTRVATPSEEPALTPTLEAPGLQDLAVVTPTEPPIVDTTPVPYAVLDTSLRPEVERWRPLAASIFWPEEVDNVLRIMQCESGGWPDADSQANRGLMQINAVHIPRMEAMGYTWDQMFEPEPNLRVAFAISEGYQWGPWSCAAIVGVP